MYKALVHFEDILDGRHPYNAGDEYPRQGYTPSKERIAELASANNRRKQAVIVLIEERVEKPAPVIEEPIMNEPVEAVADEPVKSKRGRKRKGE